ncbi:hypothetical protein [Pseudaminobacter soli (ex Li et al. 2025)]|uniref:Cadherin domain-containing protein n=1 Tax=Pseudaminobacter soli (ex Li et al. 2025) TaxID=1295366 RepID=A0A2P7RZZ3_9HYPH|nr:hypothetical protein [Mesorhizobium soli]PSJ55752.1 hypothetical protein C7I85_26030 [Mesorhizobium soli]
MLGLTLGLGCARGGGRKNPPENLASPQIAGTPYVGKKLAANTGQWDGKGSSIDSFAFQWRRDGVEIDGANAATYQPTEAEQGFGMRVAVTAISAGGQATAISEPTDAVVPALSGIALSTDTARQDAALGLIATMFMIGGKDPAASFAIVSDPGGKLTIKNGKELHLALAFSASGSYPFRLKVTDAWGTSCQQDFALTIQAVDTPPPVDPGIGGDGGEIIVPNPTDPETDSGGYESPPVQQVTQDGLKITGKNGGSATFLRDWDIPKPGSVYIMKYQADWSGMNKQGREAAIGFAFKSGNNFHMVGLRGDGANPAKMLRSKIYGDFRKANQFTATNDGLAAHGAKDGPNWLKLAISSNGKTYALSSSADGVTWGVEYTAAVPVPLADPVSALQFGPGGYFTNSDKGVFAITINRFEDLGFPVSANAAVNTQTYAEIIAKQPGRVRNTQSYAEIIAKQPGRLRNTQTYAEVVAKYPGVVRKTQTYVEIIRSVT